MSFSLSLTKQTFTCAFFTLHSNSLRDILRLHQHCGLFAERQHETVASQMCSLKKNNKNNSVQKIRAMSPTPDSESVLVMSQLLNFGELSDGGDGGTASLREGSGDREAGQEASFRSFKEELGYYAADFDLFFFLCRGKGYGVEQKTSTPGCKLILKNCFYFCDWFFHSLTQNKPTVTQVLC